MTVSLGPALPMTEGTDVNKALVNRAVLERQAVLGQTLLPRHQRVSMNLRSSWVFILADWQLFKPMLLHLRHLRQGMLHLPRLQLLLPVPVTHDRTPMQCHHLHQLVAHRPDPQLMIVRRRPIGVLQTSKTRCKEPQGTKALRTIGVHQSVVVPIE